MENTTNHDKIDKIQEDLQVFASLWSSLRARYEGTNITKTIASLLQMYRPEDGIQEYERLLKTVFVLLEDFDMNGLRLLVSMVPPPKDVSQDVVKDIFFKATGFSKHEAPMFYQKESLTPGVINSTNNRGKNKSETASIKICGDTAMSNGHQIPLQCSSQDNDLIIKQSNEKLNYYSLNNGQLIMDSENLPQAVKINWMPPSLMVHNGKSTLSNCYGDFSIKTGREKKFSRIPLANLGLMMPCNFNNIQSYYPYQLMSTNKVSYLYEKNDTSCTSTSCQSPRIFEKNSSSIKSECKGSQTKANSVNNAICWHDNLIIGKNLESSIERFLTRVKNNTDFNTKRINPTLKRSGVSSNERKEFFHVGSNNYSPWNDANHWGKNYYMKKSDTAVHRRQYYDSLFNFQRTKAAITPLTPMASTSSYDSPYYDYLQQQQSIYQHQQRLIMGQQYAQRLAQSEFLAFRNPYGLSNDWMSQCTTSRQSQEIGSKELNSSYPG
ncbi:uncharacterized protein LOC135163094 isoform X2 [Diachasmimorpha longicaudata]|uniref:uncharacterized protein LOC135163094 isoform X2 n=1 Tax=Diachasmimorpha longicaudata TaxID=58733 RepID=UPI0030B8E3FB